MRPHESPVILALAAAVASLADPDQVANGQRLNSEACSFTIAELEKLFWLRDPFQTNFS